MTERKSFHLNELSPPYNKGFYGLYSTIMEKFSIFFLLLVYFLSLSYVYVQYIYPSFEYMGLKLEKSELNFFISVSFLFVSSFILTFDERPSSFFLFIYIVASLVPHMVLSWVGGQRIIITIFSFVVFLIMILFREIRFRDPKKYLKVEKLMMYIYLYIFIITFYLIYKVGVSEFSLDLSSVYEKRKALQDKYDKILSYGVGVAFILNVLLSIIYTLRKSFMVIFPIIIGFFYFGVTGRKIFAFLPLAALALSFLVSFKGVKKYYFTIFILLIPCAYFVLFDHDITDLLGSLDGLILTLWFRRTLIFPAHLNEMYYEFFSGAGYLFWSYSKAGLGVFSYEYDVTPTKLIGEYMLTQASANTGIVGSGYMNAGIAGIIIYAIIIGVFMAIIDSTARKRRQNALYAAIALPGFVIMFTTSDLPTVFLTHGFGVIMLIILFVEFSSARKSRSPITFRILKGKYIGAINGKSSE